MGEVSLRSSRQDASIDMHHDPFDPTRVTTWPWPPGIFFLIDISRSSCICFNASWREKHDDGKLIPLPLLRKKLFWNVKDDNFDVDDLWGQNYWPYLQYHCKKLLGLIKGFLIFLQICSICLGSRGIFDFPRKYLGVPESNASFCLTQEWLKIER